MSASPSPETGRAVLRALLRERSLLGPLRVLAKHLGRLFQIPLPSFHPYVVFGPEAARKVLVTERHKLLWRNPDPVADLLRRGVLVVDGEEHDRYRILMEPALHPARLSDYTQMMIEKTDRVTAQWRDGQVVDMLVEGRKIALLIILQALFRRDAWDDLPHIWHPILKAIEFISPGPWILWRTIPRPGYKRPLRELDQYLYSMIAERRQQMQRAGRQPFPLLSGASSSGDLPSDMLQHLIDAGLDDDTIRDQMLTMLIAGHDTSTALLAWTFALLGQHPDVFSRLVNEVQNVEKSPLLDQVIKEALRLHPPIHIANRCVVEPITFEQGTVPAGERLFFSIYLTHRDPAIWDDPDAFHPERFAQGRKVPPMSFVPFGGGPRACIGSAFGQAEARIVIAHLLRQFHFEPIQPYRIRPHMGATLEPRPGVYMRVRRRNKPQ